MTPEAWPDVKLTCWAIYLTALSACAPRYDDRVEYARARAEAVAASPSPEAREGVQGSYALGVGAGQIEGSQVYSAEDDTTSEQRGCLAIAPVVAGLRPRSPGHSACGDPGPWASATLFGKTYRLGKENWLHDFSVTRKWITSSDPLVVQALTTAYDRGYLIGFREMINPAWVSGLARHGSAAFLRGCLRVLSQESSTKPFADGERSSLEDRCEALATQHARGVLEELGPLTQRAPEPPTSASSVTDAPLARSASAVTSAAGHELMIDAALCWGTDVWPYLVRPNVAERRCQDLAERVWNTADAMHEERSRRMDTSTAADVVARVDTLSKGDPVDGPRRDALVEVTRAVADAIQETAAAVHAAERLRRSVEHASQGTEAVDVSAVASLRAHAKLDALFKVDAGSLSREARGVALLCATVRVELTRTLAPRLKIYAAADTLALLFGVAIPDLPRDVTGSAPDAWRTFMSATDERTACRVSDPVILARAKTQDEKDALAFADIVCGIWHKFNEDYTGVSKENDLVDVIDGEMFHLQSEWRGVWDAVTPRAREP